MSKIINGVASEYDFPFKDFDVRYDEESIQKFNRWQDPTIEEYKKEIERLNNKEEHLIRRLEDLIIVGEEVENEWAVDICKMIIKELQKN